MNASPQSIGRAMAAAKWLNDKDLGKRVRELRARLGVSQRVLAGRVGSEGRQAEIARLEKGDFKGGKGNPPVKLLAAIAAEAGVGLDYFREGAPTNEERRDKITIAMWLEDAAKRLRGEVATSGDGDASDVVEEAEGSRQEGKAG